MFMRHLSLALISAVSATAFTQIASAADLPRKAPAYVPPPAPVLSWTGWNVGLNAGATWFNNNNINIVSAGVFNPAGFNPDIMNQGAAGATANLSNGNKVGFIGGGQIGYNWQFTNWVAGIEADIQGISQSGGNVTATTSVLANNGVPIITTLDASKKVDWLGTVRGRLGVLAWPTMLIYATGGLAYGEVRSSINISQSHAVSDTFGATAASFSETRTGWTAGAGAEWLFAPMWGAKLEYLYYDLGDVSYNAGVLNAAFTDGFVRYGISPEVSTRFNGNIVRLGLNVHF
jgi:outer membrane immunogenic protein